MNHDQFIVAIDFVTNLLLERANGNRRLCDEIVEFTATPRINQYVLDVGGLPGDALRVDLHGYLRRIADSSWGEYLRRFWRAIYDAADLTFSGTLANVASRRFSSSSQPPDQLQNQIVLDMYVRGQTAKEIAEKHSIKEKTVFEAAAKFREAFKRPVTRAMRAGGFKGAEIELVTDFRQDLFTALRRDARTSSNGEHQHSVPLVCRRVRRLAKAKEDTHCVLRQFAGVLADPRWSKSLVLEDLRDDLLDALRDDIDWIPFELGEHKLDNEAVDVYLRFWRKQRPSTISQRIEPNSSFTSKWQQLAARLQEVKNLGDVGERYFDRLPLPAREWFAVTTGVTPLAELRQQYDHLIAEKLRQHQDDVPDGEMQDLVDEINDVSPGDGMDDNQIEKGPFDE